MKLNVPVAPTRKAIPHPLDSQAESVPVPMIGVEPEKAPDEPPFQALDCFGVLLAHQRTVLFPPGAEEYLMHRSSELAEQRKRKC